MNNYIRYYQDVNLSRSEILGRYIVQTKDTVRGAAKVFGISKSTVHKDLTKVLKYENKTLYDEVLKILKINKQERHIRGGLATKDKYALLKQIKNVK